MTQPITSPESSKVLRASIWVAIGALIAAAFVCVVWVLIGDANGMVGKAFLTILLLAAFAGISIVEASFAAHRQAWFALASMVSWVLLLLIGAFLIWMPTNSYGIVGAERFFKFVVIGLIIQGALLHARLYLKAYQRHQTTFTSIVAYVTVGLVVILAVMLVIPLMTEEYVTYRSIYWRVVVSLAILAAVGTALIPLMNALFAPKKPRVAPVTGYYSPSTAAAPWPTYADGVTPLPVLPDGSPDWNAYYTGQPTTAPTPDAAASAPALAGTPTAPDPQVAPAAPAAQQPAAPQQPAASGYDGYPPAPPVPPAPQG